MPGPNPPERLAAQIQGIRDAFTAEGIQIHNYPPGAADTEAEFLFRADRILCRATDADAVALELANNGHNVDRHDPIEGLTFFTVAGLSAHEMVALVDGMNEKGVGGRPPGTITVSVDHVLHISSASCCPATEPELASSRDLDPDPGVNADLNAGQGIKVAVVDTGWLPEVGETHTWLNDPPKVAGEGEGQHIGHYKGHGTFVAGVLRTIAPEAEVYVHALFPHRGAISESELAPLLVEVLKTAPKIISMSAGTRTTADNVLIGLQAFRDHHLSRTDTMLVCAAGNDGDSGPFAPASLNWAEGVAVGALDRDGTLADYSNRGSWVDVYALGSKVVNAYPNGAYTNQEPPTTPPTIVTFTNGMASWSGTSFATPIVAGLMAAWLSKNPGKTPAQAWQALKTLADGRVATEGRPVLKPGDV